MFPYLSSNPLFFGLFVSCFWYKFLIWNLLCFDTLVLFIFLVWVHICVLDPHKFLTLIPLCFFWYIIMFLFPDLQNPLFSTILFWLFLLMKIHLHIRKFWDSAFCKIEVLARGQKKNQFKKRNRKKMINIIDPACWPKRWSCASSNLDRLLRRVSLRPFNAIHLKNLQKKKRRRCGRSRSNAQVSDWTTNYLRVKLKNSKEPWPVLSQRTQDSQA